jgi:hypothetical protein
MLDPDPNMPIMQNIVTSIESIANIFTKVFEFSFDAISKYLVIVYAAIITASNGIILLYLLFIMALCHIFVKNQFPFFRKLQQ